MDSWQKGKRPLYIDIYDQLFKDIKNEVYPPQSKLPPENELARMFGVSRMTLRQALSLLQDDGLIRSIHGKGSFVTSRRDEKKVSGLEKLSNPMSKCNSEKIEEVELHFRIDLESDYTRQVLKRKAAAVVAFERWYKQGGSVVGCGFTFMTIEMVSELGLDLQNKEQLLDFLENKVYETADEAEIEVKHSKSESSPIEIFKISEHDECDLLMESLYANDEAPILYNKYYIPREFSVLRINAAKK